MRAYYYTFGCKVNQYETENIRERLESFGYETSADHKAAEVCIVNSCTVTSEADKKCRQLIHKIRRENPSCILVCAGCMTQAHRDIAQRLPECDIIAGSHNKTRIPELIETFLNTGERVVAITDNDAERLIEPMTNYSADDKTRAYIKIQDGCDMHCSYCIIPNARGHIRSKPLGDIISEAKALIDAGHKEIILTGINLCCYGREGSGKQRLTDVIEALDSVDADFRIRLSSLEPELITDTDIERWAACAKLCPHFHLSLQSGCNEVLRAMRRRYTTDEYSALCEKLRQTFTCCAVTTDIMVGFPAETEEQHLQSLKFAEQIAFAEAHIFPYSRRPDTAADKLPCQTDGRTKHRRAAEMKEVCLRSRRGFLGSLVGTVQRVLVEKETSPEYHQGFADNYAPVRIARITDGSLKRHFGRVLIESSDGEWCYGSLIGQDIN